MESAITLNVRAKSRLGIVKRAIAVVMRLAYIHTLQFDLTSSLFYKTRHVNQINIRY